MNISKEIAEKLLEMLQTAGEIKEFTLTQAPDIIQQILLWHTIESTLALMLGLVFILIAVFCIVKFPSFLKKSESTMESNIYDAYTVCSGIIGVCAIIAGPILFLENILIMIKILVTPKIFLLEYLSEIVKRAG